MRGHHLTSRQRADGLRLFALVCILMMPLQFKGGAAETHPHAFFQFWSDTEAAPHHHGDHADDAYEATHHHSDNPHAHPIPISSQLTPDGAKDESSIGSTVGPPGMIGIGQVAGFALVLAFASTALISSRQHWQWRDGIALLGRIVTPPVPPPRVATS